MDFQLVVLTSVVGTVAWASGIVRDGQPQVPKLDLTLLSLENLYRFLLLFTAQYVVVKLYRMVVYPHFLSPLRHLPGPKASSVRILPTDPADGSGQPPILRPIHQNPPRSVPNRPPQEMAQPVATRPLYPLSRPLQRGDAHHQYARGAQGGPTDPLLLVCKAQPVLPHGGRYHRHGTLVLRGRHSQASASSAEQ